MLPLWWPRTACVYCGRRLRHGPPVVVNRPKPGPRLLACERHAPLVHADPLLRA